jgi:hypothetical protein
MNIEGRATNCAVSGANGVTSSTEAMPAMHDMTCIRYLTYPGAHGSKVDLHIPVAIRSMDLRLQCQTTGLINTYVKRLEKCLTGAFVEKE